MRYFSTLSATLQTVRKVGYYPSFRVAENMADRVAYVLELAPEQKRILVSILSLGFGFGRLEKGEFTPSEAGVIRDLIDWWSVDSVEHFQKKCFVVVNLNRDRSLVIVAAATKMIDSIIDGKSRWVSADIAEVHSMKTEKDDLLGN